MRILNAEYEESEQKYDTCLQVRTMRKPLHAKVILTDRNQGFVGSFNYTKNSWCNKTLSSIWSRSKTQKGIHFGVKEPRNNNSKNKEAKFLETISNNDSTKC